VNGRKDRNTQKAEGSTTVAKQTKPILDTKTNTEYPSMYNAGQHLAKLVKGDPKDRLVWFSIQRTFPDRFKTKNAAGEWVALNDPSVPKITRVRKAQTDDERRTQLLAELGEIEARRQAAGGTAAATNGTSTAKTPKAAPRPTVVADAEGDEEEVETEGVEEVEEEAPAAPARPKLAGAMRKG
jgi:hypothetical protein